MSRPNPVPGRCKVAADFTLLCQSGSFDSNLENVKQIPFLKRKGRFRRFNGGSSRAKYAGTRIGKRSELRNFGWL